MERAGKYFKKRHGVEALFCKFDSVFFAVAPLVWTKTIPSTTTPVAIPIAIQKKRPAAFCEVTFGLRVFCRAIQKKRPAKSRKKTFGARVFLTIISCFI